MKSTLITLLATLFFSPSFALVIPAEAQFATAISARTPVVAGEEGFSSAAVDLDADLEARDNRNDCGSAPYQNNLCSAGTNLKIEKGMVVMGALGVAVAGYLL